MNPPTRDDLTGNWPRIIRYKQISNEQTKTLAEITWCTKWIDTIEQDYRTVHEITSATIQNAYAAGYTNADIEEATGISIVSYETLILKNTPTEGLFDRGHYSLRYFYL